MRPPPGHGTPPNKNFTEFFAQLHFYRNITKTWQVVPLVILLKAAIRLAYVVAVMS